ncbi:DUF4127 family protein [uncultured Thomasclavelia sp.]|uniref:DUF4127 family protein n=1 Tax=uncultured Thomasclavelia sp. TaxID=3025759 RepID=UPI0025D17B08|nr:DUF4127 family protein [uncultured Thomasclavelia sp.]
MKTLIIPLDERPCNYQYPQMIAKTNSNIDLIMPDVSILSKKKSPAILTELDRFLFSHCQEVDNLVLSIDMLVYGGLIPSRLHHCSKDELLKRLEVIKRLKQINPQLKIYAFNCIMRCPSYDSSEEEPDYYQEYGYKLFRRKYLQNYKQRHGLSAIEQEELDSIEIPQDIIDDYEQRRNLNTEINIAVLSYVQTNRIDFLVIPQDDSSPYGYTAISQQQVVKAIKQKHLDQRVMVYPGADEVGLSLMTRAYNDYYQLHPKVYPFYASTLGPAIIPNYEDRPMHESLKSHLRVCQCQMVTSANEADFVLAINSPGKIMQEAFVEEQDVDISYTSYRQLLDFAYTIKEYLQQGYRVALCDSAFSNGGDYQLIQYLDQMQLLDCLISYAGWNTNCNTLGTTLAQACLGKGNVYKNICFRIIEDVLYQAIVRKDVVEHDLVELGLSYYDFKDQEAQVATRIKSKLQVLFNDFNLSKKHPVIIKDISMPWQRMFEIEMKIEVE